MFHNTNILLKNIGLLKITHLTFLEVHMSNISERLFFWKFSILHIINIYITLRINIVIYVYYPLDNILYTYRHFSCIIKDHIFF